MRHPVEAAIRESVYCGHPLSRQELADLELSPSELDKVRRAVAHGLEIRSTGDQQQAAEFAKERATEIIAALPEEKQDPAYAGPGRDPLAAVANPDELAAGIRRI